MITVTSEKPTFGHCHDGMISPHCAGNIGVVGVVTCGRGSGSEDLLDFAPILAGSAGITRVSGVVGSLRRTVYSAGIAGVPGIAGTGADGYRSAVCGVHMHKQLVGIRGATGILINIQYDSGRDGDAAEVRGRPVGAGCSDQYGAAGRPLEVAGLEGTAGDGDIVDRLVEFRPCAGVAVQTGCIGRNNAHQQNNGQQSGQESFQFFHVPLSLYYKMGLCAISSTSHPQGAGHSRPPLGFPSR